MNKTHWLIQGYDSQAKIYERKVNIGQLTDKQVEAVLMTLVAKAGLTFDEMEPSRRPSMRSQGRDAEGEMS